MSNKNFNIQNAVVGKTKYLASADIANNCYSVFTDNTYIYVTCGSSKLKVYTFDGASFTSVTTSSEASTYYDVWGDGTYIYALCYEGIRVYSFNGTTLTQLSFNTQITQFNRFEYSSNIWGDGTYIYATKENMLLAYSFNGVTLSYLGQKSQSGTYYYGLCGDGTYIYSIKDSAVRAYTFNGSTFTEINGYSIGTGIASSKTWYDGTYVYVVQQGEYVHQFTFNGTAFTLVKSWHLSRAGQSFLNLWGDDKYIYISGSNFGLDTLDFSGTIAWQRFENRWRTGLMGITGDANYIYIASQLQGIHAFKLLEKYQ